MEDAVIKTELHEWIDQADGRQLQEIYSLFTNYFDDTGEEEGWDKLSEYQQSQILKGLEEAEAGLGRPYEEVKADLQKKYDLNG